MQSNMVIKAVENTLKAGYRTTDIADRTTPASNILDTAAMGKQVVEQLEKIASQVSIK